jgi:hypothetical protein
MPLESRPRSAANLARGASSPFIRIQIVRAYEETMIRGLGSRPGHRANEKLAVGAEPEIRSM